jgi:nitrate reductase NapD
VSLLRRRVSRNRHSIPAQDWIAAASRRQRIRLHWMRRMRRRMPRLGHHAGRSASRGGVMTDEATIHISSAVVSVLPERRDDVLRALAALPDVEIHQRDASKIVIVMEAAESGILGSRLAEIASWQGVLSANMVFEQVERLADIGG